MKKEQLPNIPEMPNSFIDRILNKKIVIFVGAGISALCKYPLWGKLADDLAKSFRDEGLIDYQFEFLLKTENYSPIQKITILSEYLPNGDELVKNKICEHLAYNEDNCKKEMASRIAKYLFAFKSLIVTTNADLVLDENNLDNKYKIYSSVHEVPINNELDRMSILHLHGSIKDKENLIFTEKQYAKNYLPNEKLGAVLRKLIKSDNTILFIGYSISEFELLKYFLEPRGNTISNRLCKLDAYFHSEEETRLKLDKTYFNALGISLFPYFIDDKGYEALFDVLENWIKKINKQVSPSGLLHLDIGKAITSKPSKTNKQLVIKNFDNVDSTFIKEKIISSKHYKEWIKALWKKTPLFDPRPYFNTLPCSEKITRTFWSGLLILVNYLNRGKTDKTINTKLIQMMKKTSLLVRKNKSSCGTQNNIDSISMILFEIALNVIELVNDKSVFDPIMDLHVASNQYGAYMAVEDILNKKDDLIKNVPSERLFEIIRLVASYKNNDKEHYDVLSSEDNIRDVIFTNPRLYLEEAIAKLKKADWRFSNIGSFINFPTENNSILFEQKMYANWLFIATPCIERDSLKKSIESLLKSKNEIINKIGICLIGLRLNDFQDIFLDRINIFFTHKQYAADLIQLLKNNSEYIRENNAIKDAIEERLGNSDFGYKDSIYKETITKAISNSLTSVDSRFQMFDLTETEMEILFYIDSSASFYSVDTEKEVVSIYKSIKDKDIDEVITYVNESSRGQSLYFDSSLKKALDKYFKEKDFSTYKDRIKELGVSYLLSYMCNTDYVQINNDGIKKLIYLLNQLTDSQKKEAMMTILFTCQKMIISTDVDKNYKEGLINNIDYKLIEIKEEDEEIKIGNVINTSLHLYWSVLYDFTKIDEKLASHTLLQSFHYFYKNYSKYPLFKAITASWFAFIYYYESKKTREDYFEYVFNKENCETSYRVFSYVNGTNYYLIKLCELDSFNSFLLNKDDASQERVKLASRVILMYLFENELEKTFKGIINNGDTEAIEHSFYKIENNSDLFIEGDYKKRFDDFIDGCIKSLNKITRRTFSINQIFHFLVDIMIKEKDQNLDKLWNLLILLPKGFSYYHGDSIIKLITTFGNSNSNGCKKLLDSLFNSYDSTYIPDYFLVDLFTFLKEYNVFSNDTKRWITIIGEKTPSVYEKLTTIVIKSE